MIDFSRPTCATTSQHNPASIARSTAKMLGAAICFGALLPGVALAHAVVFPRTSAPGAYEKYVLRVPNEKDVATTRVEIRFPAGVRVISFADVPGWHLQVLADSTHRITGAVWTGTLPPQRFVELPFIAVNPTTETRLTWPTYQSYADGVRVEWTGPEGGKTPASATVIQAQSSAPMSSGGIPWLGGTALVLALISLGLVLRRPEVAPDRS